MTKLLLGLSAGILLGILFAPEKGEDTRKKIMDAGSDLKDRFNDWIEELVGEAEDVREEGEELADSVRPHLQ